MAHVPRGWWWRTLLYSIYFALAQCAFGSRRFEKLGMVLRAVRDGARGRGGPYLRMDGMP